MTLSTQVSSHLSLDEFLKLPETKPANEYIDGFVYQKPMSQGKHSRIQTCLSTTINEVGEPQQKALALTELRCTFGGRSLVPNIAVFESSRIPTDENGEIANRFESYPDWMIEILSTDQSPNRVINKIIFCINQGTKREHPLLAETLAEALTDQLYVVDIATDGEAGWDCTKVLNYDLLLLDSDAAGN